MGPNSAVTGIASDNLYKFATIGGLLLWIACYLDHHDRLSRLMTTLARFESSGAVHNPGASEGKDGAAVVGASEIGGIRQELANDRALVDSVRGIAAEVPVMRGWMGNLGIVISVAGFTAWYFLHQRASDQLVGAQARKAAAEASIAEMHLEAAMREERADGVDLVARAPRAPSSYGGESAEGRRGGESIQHLADN